MNQTQLIATIVILFLAHAVSGLPFHIRNRHGGHRRGGHHRFRHRRPTMPRPVPQQGTPAPPKNPGTVLPTMPRSAPQQGTPATPAPPKKPGTVLPTMPRSGPQQGTQAPPKNLGTVPPPAIPFIPFTASPPATPQTPITVPAPPPLGIIGEISEHAKMFGWDPMKVIKGCDANCDLLKYLRKQEFLIAHNWVRLLFKLPSFTWDEKLESAAKDYAMQRYDDCMGGHSDFPYGENIFWGLKLHWTPSDAVYAWFNESKWFDFKNLQCTAPPGEDCGHFTQIVWKDSLRLGCALQHCRDPTKGMLIVCEYDPPGNYDNENPLDDNNTKHQT